jgi:hypothetical protein
MSINPLKFSKIHRMKMNWAFKIVNLNCSYWDNYFSSQMLLVTSCCRHNLSDAFCIWTLNRLLSVIGQMHLCLDVLRDCSWQVSQIIHAKWHCKLFLIAKTNLVSDLTDGLYYVCNYAQYALFIQNILSIKSQA